MTNGKLVAGFLVGAGLIAGLVMYWLQVYAFYERIEEDVAPTMVEVTGKEGQMLSIPIHDYQGIDSDSSPLRYRACYRLDPAALADAQRMIRPTPTNGPSWFDCYSARTIHDDLESGRAMAYLGQRDYRPAIDRVIAVYPDGSAFEWRQTNEEAEDRRIIE